ncbi:MAG: hypothetical protein GY747_00405 [Planctomycetes bacterium]|nr:hypothetical protein [Planctomycetota bacterium]MCP4861683.1 hypothetical protein [Planctomycetota bacterium]
MLCTFLAVLLSQHPIAVLESGTRIEFEDTAEVGARVVQTAYGNYDASLDPIASVADAAHDLKLLAPLRELDYKAWLSRVAERGLISVIYADKPPQEFAAARLEALEKWGHRLDRLPGKTDRDERVELLWKKIQKASDADQALLTGELLREVSLSSVRQKRRVSLADLGRALDSKDVELRRAACRLAGYQQEVSTQHRLSKLSLTDASALVRPAAAEAMMAMDEERALGRWAVELWTSRKDSERIHAAEHLGNFGENNEDVLKTLIYALGSADYQAPGQYVFFGKQVAIISDFDVEVANNAVIADPQISVVTDGVVLHVRIISVNLSRTITGSLQRLTKADFGHDRKAWMRWYDARQK